MKTKDVEIDVQREDSGLRTVFGVTVGLVPYSPQKIQRREQRKRNGKERI